MQQNQFRSLDHLIHLFLQKFHLENHPNGSIRLHCNQIELKLLQYLDLKEIVNVLIDKKNRTFYTLPMPDNLLFDMDASLHNLISTKNIYRDRLDVFCMSFSYRFIESFVLKLLFVALKLYSD